MKMMMSIAALTFLVGGSPSIAQTAPQTTPDQSMPTQPAPQQPMSNPTGTETAPMQGPEAAMEMSDADKRKMASCMKKSKDAAAKDEKCAALMQAHPEMMSNPG